MKVGFRAYLRAVVECTSPCHFSFSHFGQSSQSQITITVLIITLHELSYCLQLFYVCEEIVELARTLWRGVYYERTDVGVLSTQRSRKSDASAAASRGAHRNLTAH